MEPFSEIDVSATETQTIARGLYTVALIDGLHEREVTFISDLFRDQAASSATGGVAETPAATMASLAWLSPLEPPALAALLPTPAHRRVFLKAAYLLAWADSKVSFAERASIDAFASALGVAAEVLALLESEVKDYLQVSQSSVRQSQT